MPRNRIIYNNLALYAGPTPSTGAHTTVNTPQLQRVISANYSVDRPVENITEFGTLAPIDQIATESPTVNLDFSYYNVDVINETRLGFTVNTGTSALSNILNKTSDSKNYFIAVAGEGLDVVGESNADLSVIGVGNGYISSFTAEGSIGDFPTTSITVEGLNIAAYLDAVAEEIPAVDPTTGRPVTPTQNFTLADPVAANSAAPAAIERGDVEIAFGNASALFHDLTTVCAQSYNISFDLNNESIDCLGSRYSRSREPIFPVDITCTVEFLGNDIITGNLTDFLCSETNSDVTINLKQPNCEGTGDIALQYMVKNARLQSQNWSNSIGPAQTVSVTWIGQLGASSDTGNGLFISGVTGYV